MLVTVRSFWSPRSYLFTLVSDTNLQNMSQTLKFSHQYRQIVTNFTLRCHQRHCHHTNPHFRHWSSNSNMVNTLHILNYRLQQMNYEMILILSDPLTKNGIRFDLTIPSTLSFKSLLLYFSIIQYNHRCSPFLQTLHFASVDRRIRNRIKTFKQQFHSQHQCGKLRKIQL